MAKLCKSLLCTSRQGKPKDHRGSRNDVDGDKDEVKKLKLSDGTDERELADESQTTVFPAMTNTLHFSVDINKTTPALVSLFEKASAFQTQWRRPAIVNRMITRYYRFMQLKALYHGRVLLVPTLDIEIIWQTHLIRPEMYQYDCLRLFHRIIDHSLILDGVGNSAKSLAFSGTCKLYKERFGTEYCPLATHKKKTKTVSKHARSHFDSVSNCDTTYSYWDETEFKFASKQPKDYENPFSFTEDDVILDSYWLGLCKSFMFTNPEQEIHLNSSLMQRLSRSYHRFLYMAAKYPPNSQNPFVHSTYAIDIIWYSHMQKPLKYMADCFRLVGYVIDHAPWPLDEVERKQESLENAKENWKKEFNNDMTTDHVQINENNAHHI